MAGYVQRLDYDMYDVAIVVNNANDIANLESLDFTISFIAEDYTRM
jgi:hypothetical protein